MYSSAVIYPGRSSITTRNSPSLCHETTYNPQAIGSHACWKFFNSADLGTHLDQHLRTAWAMSEARRQLS